MNNIQQHGQLQSVLTIFVDELNAILRDNPASICIYGSAAMGDFREGWSDIDFVALTEKQVSVKDTEELVELRQRLVKKHGNSLFRSLEGVVLSRDALLAGHKERVVYWGTSGQRVTDGFSLDSFGRKLVREHGVMLTGEDFRTSIPLPTYEQFHDDIMRHYTAIRRHARETGRNIHSFGWLLDIARCIYTLRTGEVIVKTAAGEWALQNHLCPVKEAMELAIVVRKDPPKYASDHMVLGVAARLGRDIQRFADVLAAELATNAERQ